MIVNKTALIVSTLLFSHIASVQAEDVDASTLIGNFYGGIHGAYLKADDDRLGSGAEFDKGTGFGLEAGYRLSAPLEFRLSYTSLRAEIENGPTVDNINKYSLDALYFPTHKSVYLLGGFNGLDFDDDVEAAANLGLGYRHYFTERLSAYVEGKANYQFDDNYTDGIARVGLVYFFGQNEKPQPVILKKAAPAPIKKAPVAVVVPAPKKVIAIVDNDNDGVADSKDNCLTTPENDKVDQMGCTIFTTENISHRLSVNFDSNKSVVKAQYFEEVEKVADFLGKYPHVKITIDGYSSIRGNADYNKKLSQRRADAIVALLIEKYSVDGTRMEAIGHGETNLLDTRNTAEAHRMNRRIEVNIDEMQSTPIKR